MWGAFAWLRAYEVDPQMKYVQRAAVYHDWIHTNELAWAREKKDTCTYGLNTTSAPISGIHSGPIWTDSIDKNTICNTQWLQLSLRLHPFAKSLGKPTDYYLTLAQDAWRWLEHSNLRNSSGLWSDGSCPPPLYVCSYF